MGRRMCVVQSAFGVYAVRSDRPHAPPGAAGRCVDTLEGERSLMSTPAIKDGGPVTKVCFGSAPYACVFSLSVLPGIAIYSSLDKLEGLNRRGLM